MAMRQRQRAGGKRGIAAVLVAVVAMFSAAVLTFGYNLFQDNLGTLSSPVPAAARWNSMPVAWLLNPDTPNGNVSQPGCLGGSPGACIQQPISAGFTAWMNAQVAGQSLTTVNVSGPTSSTLTDPVYNDCQNVAGFSDTNSSDFSTGTIAFTELATVTRPSGTTGPFQYQCSGGGNKTCNTDDCMADADIEFNPSIQFTTSLSPPANTFNLQSVATHEEGHLLGLDHSGIGHTVMFPFGDSTAAHQQTTLATDDAVGISYLYPSSNYLTATGAISGTVNLSGTGVFGAHVIAVNANTGNAVIDGITASDGTYTLDGVSPGNYYVLALPFSPNADSGVLTIDNFSGWLCGYGDSQCTTVLANPTSYTGRYH
jgi:Matrixin